MRWVPVETNLPGTQDPGKYANEDKDVQFRQGEDSVFYTVLS